MGYKEDSRAHAIKQWNTRFTDEERKKYQKYWDADLKTFDSIHDKSQWKTNIGYFTHSGGDRITSKGITADEWDRRYAEHLKKQYAAKWEAENPSHGNVAESTIQAQSTQQANLRAQQTGTPDANNQVSESQKDTETKRRQNKAKGKRGFVVARESGQGINI